jgi:NAD(P)-dependent dehydrogenase (short-subunit alcohol dehydrogenase family)
VGILLQDAPHMRKQGGGRIINISTVGAHTPPPILQDYDSEKAAMLTFSKATSFELAPDNILVNCVCPALIRTLLKRFNSIQYCHCSSVVVSVCMTWMAESKSRFSFNR